MCSVGYMKNPSLKRLKRGAPRIPDFTCPWIDSVLARLDQLDITHRDRQYITRRLERLRTANEQLRDSSQYWYDAIKQHLT